MERRSIKQYRLLVADRDPCDDTSVRRGADARSFVSGHLGKLGTDVERGETLYVCPLSGQLWLKDFPLGEPDGPAMCRLRVVHEPPGWYLPPTNQVPNLFGWAGRDSR
jgi:hypothetical protein